MAGGTGHLRPAVNMVTIGANLGFTGGHVWWRVRIRAGRAGFAGECRLIAMTAGAFRGRRRPIGWPFIVALRAGESGAMVGFEQQRRRLGTQRAVADGRRDCGCDQQRHPGGCRVHYMKLQHIAADR